MIKTKLIAFNIDESVRNDLPTLESLIRRAKELEVDDLRIAGVPLVKRVIQAQLDAGNASDLLTAFGSSTNPHYLLKHYRDTDRLLQELGASPDLKCGPYTIEFTDFYCYFISGATVTEQHEDKRSPPRTVRRKIEIYFGAHGVELRYPLRREGPAEDVSYKAAGDAEYGYLAPRFHPPFSSSVSFMWKLQRYEYTVVDLDLHQIIEAVTQRINETIARIEEDA